MDYSFPTRNQRHRERSGVQRGDEYDNNDDAEEGIDSYFALDGQPSPKRQRLDPLNEFSAFTGAPGPSLSPSGTFRAVASDGFASQPGATHSPAALAIGGLYFDSGDVGNPVNYEPWSEFATFANGQHLLQGSQWQGGPFVESPLAAMGGYLATEISSTLQHQHSFTDPPSQRSFGNVTVRDDMSDSVMYSASDGLFPEAMLWPNPGLFSAVDNEVFDSLFLDPVRQPPENMTGIATSGFLMPPQPYTAGFTQHGGLNSDRFHSIGLFPQEPFQFVSNFRDISISPVPSTPGRASPTDTKSDSFVPSWGGAKPQTTSSERPTHKRGRRSGPMEAEQRKKTKAMRHKRGCLGCWLSRTRCSMDEICTRCARLASKSTEPSLPGQICIRSRLVDYEPLFCPDPLISHLQEARVKAFVKQNVASWINNIGVETKVTEGLTYPSIVLTAHEFCPADPQTLACRWLVRDENDGSQKFVEGYTMPLGLQNCNEEAVKAKLLEHVSEIVEGGRDPNEASEERMSGLGWNVLSAIQRFFKRASDAVVNKKLLRNSLMLYAMHYFNSRTLRLTPSSLTSAVNLLRHPTQLPYKAIQTSRLIGTQLKSAMQSLIRDTSRSVLEDLEHELRQGGKASWPTCFCVILILCMAAESVQVAIDGLVTFLLGQGAELEEGQKLTRDTSRQICRALDELHYRHCVEMFHGVYRTKKPKSGGSGALFNPMKNGLSEDPDEGLDRPMVEFVEDMRGILRDRRDEIKERAKPPNFSVYGEDRAEDHQAHHLAFRAKNAGRLVASFLTSFAV